MSTPVVVYVEPLTLSVGDTISFTKFFANYLPSDGWSLLYSVRQNAGPSPPVQFTSTADITNTLHVVLVSSGTTTAWLPGEYELTGYAVNTSLNPAERFEIYSGIFNLTPNLGNNVDNVNLTTHAQRMIPLIESQLEILAAHALIATRTEQLELIREKRMDLEKQLAWNKQIRQNEVALQNVANGRPSGQKIRSQFQVVDSGCSPWGGQYWPFSG